MEWNRSTRIPRNRSCFNAQVGRIRCQEIQIKTHVLKWRSRNSCKKRVNLPRVLLYPFRQMYSEIVLLYAKHQPADGIFSFVCVCDVFAQKERSRKNIFPVIFNNSPRSR